jgi:hypothetical protein
MLGNGEGRGAIQSCKKKKKKVSQSVSQRALYSYTKKKNLAVTATKRDDHLLLSSLS